VEVLRRDSGPWTPVEVLLTCDVEPLDECKPRIACFITAISCKIEKFSLQ